LSDTNIENCVLCMQDSFFRPSRITVKFLDLLKFKCKFYEFGCQALSVYSNWHEHSEKCKIKFDLLKIISEQKTEIENMRSEQQKM